MDELQKKLMAVEEKLDFLIFMQTKTITQPSALAGGKPRITIIPGEVLFSNWKQSKNQAEATKNAVQSPKKPLPSEGEEDFNETAQ